MSYEEEAVVLGSKQPYEEYYITFNFKSWLGTSDIASVAFVGAVDTSNSSDVTATITDSTKQANSSKTVSVWVRAGSTDKVYQLTVRIVANDTNASKYELDALLPVNEV